MEVVQALIQKQTGLKVDQPGSNGGTKSIGNTLIERHFPIIPEYLRGMRITFTHRPAITKIHSQLAVLLRVLNAGQQSQYSGIAEIMPRYLTFVY